MFGQLWDYETPGWAATVLRAVAGCVEVATAAVLPEVFATLVDVEHWEGIVAYCDTENKVALGFVEGLNNKIREL